MRGLCEPGRAISKSKKKGDCAGSLCVRCNSASGLTLGGSVPKRMSLLYILHLLGARSRSEATQPRLGLSSADGYRADLPQQLALALGGV